MADSFNGVSTFLVLDGSTDRAAPYNYTIRSIPGGPHFWADFGGQGPRTRKMKFKFDNDTDYFNFCAMEGQIGTLVCFDFNGTAQLLDVQRDFRNPPGSSTEATVTFLEF